MVTLTGGTILLMWIGEQITSRGVGNGISLIIFCGHRRALPAKSSARRSNRHAPAPPIRSCCCSSRHSRWRWSAFIVFMERAQRRLFVTYPKRQVGNKIYGGESSHLPLKLNVSGVIPPIFASSILLLPTTIASFNAPEFAGLAADHRHLYRAAVSRFICSSMRTLILFFTFFYTSVVFNPDETAENLKKYGGVFPVSGPARRARNSSTIL